ncbi:tRNA 5-methoxyuridine(34)/uridine 5-oxyacetic acid(34) synthase CmoB [Desulfofustis limnaeus]|jgi:tRNA (mo5U34)-methyltransferase|uniref:tRNA U34 carboxymethyltransferase n=1 Tax=Desulfofustis limnaeus TaxID=2740163 RepID=A0ABN6M580_9BACT|nr:tRNA 5-methoxyuridine(34)/uridine 5-oxyacetic acid(34) synthase CmoB [Desulfofustis limnaeus]MDX9895761.1 tRNA 5-methoxyuridine(34)/uridine 5-oxyacetic acid(34) synthase CmoB [Desulfofustis sp.]BDD88054.1 tRNA U34 carboxymethyltransferase [Desulfofustis limnaeus]
MHYLDFLPDTVRRADIEKISAQRHDWVRQPKKGFLRYRRPFESLRRHRAKTVVCTGDTVLIGSSDEIDSAVRATIEADLRSFMPWRKGPFSVFGIDIDAEWRSERKWRRVLARLPELSGKTVADIGCNNGYYLFRMVPHRPRLALGFEPSVQHYFCFQALNAMAGCAELAVDLLGVEQISLFPETFDVVLLMGVIYHRPSPIEVLRDIHTALKPGGRLIVESQAIPGEDPVALFPERTYAKVPGTYFVPTGACLRNWLHRAGFARVELFDAHPMSGSEQRRTDWMIFESYQDFIDPADPSRTVEGYPAPWRVYLCGEK